MEFKVSIECDNAAFDGSDLGREVARILRKLERHVYDMTRPRSPRDHFHTFLYDVNGNKVGSAEVIE